MSKRPVPTGRLRRRLTIAFVLVAGIASGALALGSFLLVRQARLSDSLDAAKAEARFDLVLAPGLIQISPQNLLGSFRQNRVNIVLVTRGGALPSNSNFNPPIPRGLRSLVGSGQLAYQRVMDGRRHLLVIGGLIPGSKDELYFVFPEDRIQRDLAQLRNILLVGWGVVVILAGLVGRLLARRTLDPVAKASQAARSMAEGILATRLPVTKQDEFGAWAASFNEMAEALEAKIAALQEAQARERRFTSDVSHELRTPLTALVGEASLLAENLERMPPEVRRPAELLIQDVARLRRLVDELMEISRFDAGRESIQVDSVDLMALIQAAVRARGWDQQVEVSGEDVALRSDRRRLERIVANLMGNALEHGGGRCRVSVGINGQRAFVEVTDRGQGIPSEHLPHLFDRFFKADPSRRGTGSGLGLAIAMENARLLGGDIEVWSEVGTGTRFTLLLPVMESLPGRAPAVSPQHESEAP
ncbi:MAG TPA: HAMP domain-containing sensor histidine kinase [Actinomycetota bacterium]